jgi:hypothetical protein
VGAALLVHQRVLVPVVVVVLLRLALTAQAAWAVLEEMAFLRHLRGQRLLTRVVVVVDGAPGLAGLAALVVGETALRRLGTARTALTV